MTHGACIHSLYDDDDDDDDGAAPILAIVSVRTTGRQSGVAGVRTALSWLVVGAIDRRPTGALVATATRIRGEMQPDAWRRVKRCMRAPLPLPRSWLCVVDAFRIYSRPCLIMLTVMLLLLLLMMMMMMMACSAYVIASAAI